MARIKGNKITSKFAFVRDEYGEDMLQRVLRSMSARDRADLHLVLETGWYSFDLYQRLMVAVCQVAGGGDDFLYTAIGRYSAEHAFASTYKVFLGKDPRDLVKTKMIPMHSMRNEPAEMEAVSERDGHCVIRIIEPRSTREVCKVMRAFIARSFELCGGKAVELSEPSCSAAGARCCEYELKWQ
jgi:predicted hydrocarbon binding protein